MCGAAGASRDAGKSPSNATANDPRRSPNRRVDTRRSSKCVAHSPIALRTAENASRATLPYHPQLLVVIATEGIHWNLAEIPLGREYPVTC